MNQNLPVRMFMHDYLDYIKFSSQYPTYKSTTIKRLVQNENTVSNDSELNPYRPVLSSLSLVEMDIVDIDDGYILQVTNTLNKMGAGVAKDIYEKYPQVKLDYHMYMETMSVNNQNPLGDAQIVNVAKDLYVVNLMAQPTIRKTYGNYPDPHVHLDYKALEQTLLEFSIQRQDLGILPVYVPHFMGCGLANGDWNTVTDILRRTLINVIVCMKPRKTLFDSRE